jgi:hypothetical protein
MMKEEGFPKDQQFYPRRENKVFVMLPSFCAGAGPILLRVGKIKF